MRWPFGPPHLALNPPFFVFVFFVVCFCFLFFLKIEKTVFFPNKKGICVVQYPVFPFVSF